MTLQEKLRTHREIEQRDLDRWNSFTNPRTAEAIEVCRMIDEASPEVRDAMMRGLSIYFHGTEHQKQILDRIARERPEWPQIIEILEQAEAE